MTLRVMTQDRTAHLSRSLQHHGVTVHIGGQQWSYLNDSDGLWLTGADETVMVVEYTDSYTFTVLDSMDYNVQAYTVLMLHVAIDRAGRRDATLRINREDMCVLIAMSNDMQNMVQRIRSNPVTPISLINI
jgi:hypothetical protein